MVMLTTRLHPDHPDHDDHNQADQFLSTEPELPGCINCFCSGANLQKYHRAMTVYTVDTFDTVDTVDTVDTIE